MKKWFTPYGFAGVPRLMGEFGYEQTADIKQAHMVVFTGGSDINPALYGQKPHRTTWWHEDRDKLEVETFHRTRELGLPMFGICRGAQLICALNGGSLWQHTNHHDSHPCFNTDGEFMFTVSSLHHQMCRPNQDNCNNIGFAKNLSSVFVDEETEIDGHLPFGSEPELMYHHNINALCVQGHPEFMESQAPFVKWCDKFIKEKM